MGKPNGRLFRFLFSPEMKTYFLKPAVFAWNWHSWQLFLLCSFVAFCVFIVIVAILLDGTKRNLSIKLHRKRYSFSHPILGLLSAILHESLFSFWHPTLQALASSQFWGLILNPENCGGKKTIVRVSVYLLLPLLVPKIKSMEKKRKEILFVWLLILSPNFNGTHKLFG